MKAQAQVWVWGEGGEQLSVLTLPTAVAEFDIPGFVEQVVGWVVDYFTGGAKKLAADLEDALRKLGGDVKAQAHGDVSFLQGGGLYNGDVRLASYAHIFFHAWTGDDIKPSFAEVQPQGPGLVNLGEVRYTRGDFQYEHRFLLLFSLLAPGKYGFTYATGDSGTFQDATIAYTIGMQIDQRVQAWPTIQQKQDDMVAHGWFNFGDATTEELVTPDGIGRYRHYRNGSLYWSPGRGAHLVLGLIREKYASLGWERGLGYPLTDELPTPDGAGRFNHFQSASIYWTPRTGAHEVHGAIRERWAALGWERSFLGYPTSDEQQAPDGSRYSSFQGGTIRWTTKTGAQEFRSQFPNTKTGLAPAIIRSPNQ